MIACFFSNISAKYYKNLSMLSRVIAKNVGDVLRHSVVILYTKYLAKMFRMVRCRNKKMFLDRTEVMLFQPE